MPEQNRERDILLAWNEFAYVQDMTKGDINLYVGPTKISLSNTERMVMTDPESGAIVPLRDEHIAKYGIQQFIRASSSQYVILKNPTKNADSKYTRGPNQSVDLQMGKKVITPGPTMFPLWPGQVASIVNGHSLSENEFLFVKVYDNVEGLEAKIKEEKDDKKAGKIPIGTEFIIRGTETSFYIPTTGLEVVPKNEGESIRYVRKALTLANDEYCILQNSKGDKKYVRGPNVVFPEPDESLVEKEQASVFKAQKVKPEKGLHLIVTKNFEVKGENQEELLPAGKYKIGQEIFLEGKEGLFFPSENIEIIKEVSPLSIAENEGIYARDKKTGKISTIKGPKNYLPDPTKTDVITRDLDKRIEDLYHTENRDKQKAVSVYVPPNHAVMVISNEGRKVAVGPQTYTMDYSENLEKLALSTGTPKTDAKLLETVFLQVEGNKVSDVIQVETKDHVVLDVKVSYRLSFKNEPEKWFNVNNYVGLLCDHLSSIVRSAVKSTSLEEFYSNSTELIRNSVLGEKTKDEKRTGRLFNENNMQVYDLEVLRIDVQNKAIEDMLAKAQQTAFNLAIKRREKETEFELTKATENIVKQMNELKMKSLESELAFITKQKEVETNKVQTINELDKLKKVGAAQNDVDARQLEYNFKKTQDEEQHKRSLENLDAQTKALKEQMSAISPQYIAALTRFGDQQTVIEATKHLGQLSVLENKSVQEIVERALKGLPFMNTLKNGMDEGRVVEKR